MTPTSQQLQKWLNAKEDEHLEFKEAKANFHFEKLVKYCAALANEGGGSIILGVTDKRPRRVVGSTAFAELERTKAGLIDKLRLRIEAEAIAHPDGRVLVFTAPSRPIGVPVAVEGAYWMRAGEELSPMTPDMLRRIFDESGPDYSAEVCPHATLADLDPDAIDIFRIRWLLNSQNERLRDLPAEQLLKDAELVTDRGVTYAALILLGTRPALGRFLAQAEVVFEYRSSDATGPANQRDEYREGFLPYYDKLWETISLRNDLQHYLEHFVMHHIPTFREAAVREAILNAVSHRDYRHPGSVFVRGKCPQRRSHQGRPLVSWKDHRMTVFVLKPNRSHALTQIRRDADGHHAPAKRVMTMAYDGFMDSADCVSKTQIRCRTIPILVSTPSAEP